MNLLSVNLDKWLICSMALLVPMASIAYYGLAASDPILFLSEKPLVSAYQHNEPRAERPLFYLNYLPVSASFYTRGQVQKLGGDAADQPQTAYWLAVHKKSGDASNRNCRLEFQPNRGLFDLYLCQGMEGTHE